MEIEPSNPDSDNHSLASLERKLYAGMVVTTADEGDKLEEAPQHESKIPGDEGISNHNMYLTMGTTSALTTRGTLPPSTRPPYFYLACTIGCIILLTLILVSLSFAYVE